MISWVTLMDYLSKGVFDLKLVVCLANIILSFSTFALRSLILRRLFLDLQYSSTLWIRRHNEISSISLIIIRRIIWVFIVSGWTILGFWFILFNLNVFNRLYILGKELMVCLLVLAIDLRRMLRYSELHERNISFLNTLWDHSIPEWIGQFAFPNHSSSELSIFIKQRVRYDCSPFDTFLRIQIC